MAHKERSHKAAIIRSIRSRGLELHKRKLAENLSRQDAIELEIFLIEIIGRSPNGPLSNITAGGEGSIDPLPETRKKLSDLAKRERPSRRGVPLSPERRAQISASLRGRPKKPFSEEHRRKIAQSQLGKKRGPPSPETKEKLSIANGGKSHRVGWHHTEETRKKISTTRLDKYGVLGSRKRSRLSVRVNEQPPIEPPPPPIPEHW